MNRFLFPFAFLVLFANGVNSYAQQTRDLKFIEVKPEKQIKFQAYFRHIVVAPDGSWVAAGGDGILKIWDVKSGKMIRSMGGDKTPDFRTSHGHLLASPDGRFLVDTGVINDSTASVCLYDTQSWKLVRRISLKHLKKEGLYWTLSSAAFSDDGRLALYTRTKVIEIYDPMKGKLLKTIDLKKHSNDRLGRIGFVQEGKKIACIFGENRFGAPPLEFDLIDIESGKREKWNKLPIIYRSEKCSFGRNCFVSVDSRGKGYYPLPKDIVNVKENIKPIQIPYTGHTRSVSVSWDGKFIAAIENSAKHGDEGRIQIWKTED